MVPRPLQKLGSDSFLVSTRCCGLAPKKGTLLKYKSCTRISLTYLCKITRYKQDNVIPLIVDSEVVVRPP